MNNSSQINAVGYSLAFSVVGAFLTAAFFTTAARGTFQEGGHTDANLPLRVLNKTRLEVIDVERNEENRARLKVYLKNSYKKPVCGYIIGTTDYTIEPDLFPHCLQPGDVLVRRITVPRTRGRPEHIVRIVTVVFDDNTAEGDQSGAARILDRRNGRVAARTEILPHLVALLKEREVELLPALRSARSKIEATRLSQENSRSFEFRAGFENAKESITLDLSEFEDGLLTSRLDPLHLQDRLKVILNHEEEYVRQGLGPRRGVERPILR